MDSMTVLGCVAIVAMSMVAIIGMFLGRRINGRTAIDVKKGQIDFAVEGKPDDQAG